MAPSLLLPCPVSVDPLGFLHRDCARPTKFKFLLPAGFSQRDSASTTIASKLKLKQKKVKASPVCELGLESELPSESPAEALIPPSSSSSSLPTPLMPNLTSERGILFCTGSSFFRAQSSLGRDLAVLAAALYKRAEGRLRVLDAMSGCGVRALRYLTQADADFVLANDCNPDLHTTIVENLSRYAPLQGLHFPPEPFIRPSASGNPKKPCREEDFSWMEYVNRMGDSNSTENPSKTEVLRSNIEAGQTSSATLRASTAYIPGLACDTHHTGEIGMSPDTVKWQVCHEEAARLLLKCNLNMDFFDFIDVDSFGSDSFFLGPALSVLRFGGLLFVTSTDGFSSGGHRPYK